MKGDFQSAKSHYQQALELSPHLAEVHYNYGLALSHQKMYAQAEEVFRKALADNPYFADAHNNLGATLEAQGKLTEAEENYRKATENDPNHREAYFSLGRVAMKQGKPEEAIALFLKSLTPEDGKTPTFMYTLAYVYAGTRDFTQAQYYGKKARELAESFSDRRMVEVLDRFLANLERAEAARGSLGK
jgi:Tfp pilus assembly protein PilF